MTASAEARETALLAAQAAADKLATNVSIVDVSERLAITDAFVLAAAPNERQVQAIVDEVEERLRGHGVKPVRREGVAEARWVLLDFVDVVVHVQHAEERAYYALERLWKDCPTIPFVDSAAPPAAAPPAADGGTLSADDVDPGSADPVPLRPDPDETPGEASGGASGGPSGAATGELVTEDELADDDVLEGDPLQDGSGGQEATGR
ncbi:ribosome-associated protein [Geodermatophilus bullaregiensis]|uniref:ribosome silencing factor n=1 Tax=Geodermatophilus bullaregiensis TaxID=1564160 RepID=UPI001EF96491|nr:ribosome silencing factor [Geodermatophilus bullaregiensis]MBM7808127.1 ribosome-associated protein [Geodermatophilus bullaregiensis]